MALTTRLFVCVLLATELASVLYPAHYVRVRRKRHRMRFPTSHFPTFLQGGSREHPDRNPALASVGPLLADQIHVLWRLASGSLAPSSSPAGPVALRLLLRRRAGQPGLGAVEVAVASSAQVVASSAGTASHLWTVGP